MNFTHPAHQEILYALLDNQVDFLLVGGYAVIYHGYVRTTGDMDIWLRPSNENKERLTETFLKLGFNPDGVSEIAKMDFTTVILFHVGDIPERIDFLTQIAGLKYQEAWEHRVFLQTKSHRIPVLNLDDLLVSKLSSGRHKDLADIEALKKIKDRNR